MTNMRSFIRKMPKAELHVHIEGTLEPEMKFALAKRNGVKLPYGSAKQLKAAYGFDDLPSFLAVYYEGMSVLLKEPDFYAVTYAYLAKAHSQNVVYAEMFFDPQAHTARGVAFDTVIRGIRRAQLDAEKRLGIRSQLIMCFLRDWSAEFAMATLLESLPYKQWIVGVGLDSDDPAYFAGYMTENLIAVQEEADLSKAELLQLSRNAFEAGWLPRKQRDEYLTKLDAYAA